MGLASPLRCMAILLGLRPTILRSDVRALYYSLFLYCCSRPFRTYLQCIARSLHSISNSSALHTCADSEAASEDPGGEAGVESPSPSIKKTRRGKRAGKNQKLRAELMARLNSDVGRSSLDLNRRSIEVSFDGSLHMPVLAQPLVHRTPAATKNRPAHDLIRQEAGSREQNGSAIQAKQACCMLLQRTSRTFPAYTP